MDEENITHLLKEILLSHEEDVILEDVWEVK